MSHANPEDAVLKLREIIRELARQPAELRALDDLIEAIHASGVGRQSRLLCRAACGNLADMLKNYLRPALDTIEDETRALRERQGLRPAGIPADVQGEIVREFDDDEPVEL